MPRQSAAQQRETYQAARALEFSAAQARRLRSFTTERVEAALTARREGLERARTITDPQQRARVLAANAEAVMPPQTRWRTPLKRKVRTSLPKDRRLYVRTTQYEASEAGYPRDRVAAILEKNHNGSKVRGRPVSIQLQLLVFERNEDDDEQPYRIVYGPSTRVWGFDSRDGLLDDYENLWREQKRKYKTPNYLLALVVWERFEGPQFGAIGGRQVGE